MFNIVKREEWMTHGECRNPERNPDDWFPSEGDSQAPKRAKKVCVSECPVLLQCREYAVNFPVAVTGVWGGWSKTEIQQERMRRGLKVRSEANLSSLPVDWKPEF